MKIKASILFISSWLWIAGCDHDDEPLPKVQTDTFWEIATPASQGLDGTVLDDVADNVRAMKGVYSLLIARNGKLVFEQYQNGAAKNALLPLRSVTKRITATLVGISMDMGNISSTDDSLKEYFPEAIASGAAPGWETITVSNLLNMVSGMDWVEDDDLGEYEHNLKDPLPFIFGRAIVHEPETFYSYNSPGIHLLSYIVERSSGQEVGSFAGSRLFQPLGILGYKWEKDGNKVPRGGAGLELTARDQAKIGLLYLNGGQWNNQQIVSEAWVNTCLNGVISLDTIQGNHIPGISIGNTWWSRTINSEYVVYGDGYGGQILMVIPSRQMVIVMNRVYKVEPDVNNAAFEEFFAEVLPGVIDSILD